MRALVMVCVMAAMACSGSGGTGGTSGGSSTGGGSGGSSATGGGSGGSGGSSSTGGGSGATGGGTGGSSGGNVPGPANVTGAVTTTVTVTPVAAYQMSSGKSGVQFNSPASGRYSLILFYTVTGRLMTGTFSPSAAGFTCGGDFIDTDAGTHWTMARANPADGGAGDCQIQVNDRTAYNISAIGESYTVHGTASATMPDLAGDAGTVNVSLTF